VWVIYSDDPDRQTGKLHFSGRNEGNSQRVAKTAQPFNGHAAKKPEMRQQGCWF